MDGNPAVAFVGAAVGFGVFLLVMLIGREIVTWYWKVNEALNHLDTMKRALQNIDRNLNTVGDAILAKTQTSRGETGGPQ